MYWLILLVLNVYNFSQPSNINEYRLIRGVIYMKKLLKTILFIAMMFMMTSCNQADGQQSNQDYEATKKMVVDILKTDDGKNVLKDVLNEEEMKHELVINSETVKQAIEQTFNDEKGKQFFGQLFEDPSFVQSYVEATRESDEDLMKGLMTDSTYQERLMQLFQNEQMQQLIATALKSQTFKSHLEDSIQETLESPLFKAQMIETLLKAAQEQQQNMQGQDDQENGGGGEDSGGQGGDSGNSSSGGGGGSS